MQILVPIAGRSAFFPEAEYYFPKPLIEVAGQPMIELVVRNLKRSVPGSSFVFIVDARDCRDHSIDRIVRLAGGPASQVIERQGATSGALCSCLLAIDALDPEAPLLISNGDQIHSCDLGAHLREFENAGVDAGVLTFDSVHPRWSYVIDAGNRRIAQAVEKKVVSRNAVAGVYWFRRAATFIEAAKRAMIHDAHVGGQFFVSASLNEILLMGGEVMFLPIPASDYQSFYSPARIEEFERSPVASQVRSGSRSAALVNVVIPAAGEGSRFAKAGWKKPKPFIDVEGRPMIEHVVANVAPKDARATLLLRRAHIEAQPDIVHALEKGGSTVLPVEALTEGTACTVLLARSVFDDERPMMVANSDQVVDFDVEEYVRDCFDRGLDGSILVFRDPTMDPKWSFARLDEHGMVVEVAEKKPISDLATVGVYLFTRGRDFVRSALDMIVRNERVNNEFYTCPVYNHMIAAGAKIGVWEVPMHAMHGLGTPEDLTGYLDERSSCASADSPD